VHYGFYDAAKQCLEEFESFIVAQNLDSQLGPLKEVGITNFSAYDLTIPIPFPEFCRRHA
jgi:hypothetical protein